MPNIDLDKFGFSLYEVNGEIFWHFLDYSEDFYSADRDGEATLEELEKFTADLQKIIENIKGKDNE